VRACVRVRVFDNYACRFTGDLRSPITRHATRRGVYNNCVRCLRVHR